MDWTRQFDEMSKAWIEAQAQVLEAWRVATPGRVGGTAWQQALDAWKAAVDGGLAAQADWASRWTESAPAMDAGAERWAEQGRQMMDAWLQTQRQVWNAWFQTLRGMDPSRSGTPTAVDPDYLKAWSEAARQMSEAQTEWARRWMGGA